MGKFGVYKTKEKRDHFNTLRVLSAQEIPENIKNVFPGIRVVKKYSGAAMEMNRENLENLISHFAEFPPEGRGKTKPLTIPRGKHPEKQKRLFN